MAATRSWWTRSSSCRRSRPSRTLRTATTTFELLNAVHMYAAEPYIASRFAVDVDREIGVQEREAIDNYVGAVYLDSHRRANLEISVSSSTNSPARRSTSSAPRPGRSSPPGRSATAATTPISSCAPP